METSIEIHDLRMQAFHGVLEQEHTVGNLYQIDCVLTTDFRKAMQSDSLEDTISYAEAVEVIKKEMMIPSRLLEHVAGRICEELRRRFGARLQDIDLRVAKLNPPINADIKACSVHVTDNKVLHATK